jgi:hypothetical protein
MADRPDDGRWTMADGRWPMADRRWPIDECNPPHLSPV